MESKIGKENAVYENSGITMKEAILGRSKIARSRG
jgi:hypothetical protein